MIQKFVDEFMESKEWIRAQLAKAHPGSYLDVVKPVIQSLNKDGDTYEAPDPARITQIDHGDYQGTLLFVIAAHGYQPSTFWAVKVYYGSCSGCDTLEGIRNYEDGAPSERQLDAYMTLALHVVQNIVEIGGESQP